MDLNYLLHRHQISLMRADAAACCASRASHRELAAGYLGLIAHARRLLGLTQPLLQAA